MFASMRAPALAEIEALLDQATVRTAWAVRGPGR